MPKLRRYTATVFLLIIVFAGVSVVTVSRIHPDHAGALALICLILAVLLGGRAIWQQPGWGHMIVLFSAVIMLPFAVIARSFGRVDMMAFMFHMDFGLAGGGIEEFERDITRSVLALGFIVVAIWMLDALWRSRRWLIAVATIALVGLNPAVQFTVRRAVLPTPPSLVEEFTSAVSIEAPRPLPDIVLIYLEGLDGRFANTAAFGNAYDPLRSLSGEAITFTNVVQVEGTGWSIAGMVATQCGVPLMPRGLLSGNMMSRVGRFLPSVSCLGDVVVSHDYALSYVVGSDSRFAGIDKFYREHGNAEIIDLGAINAAFPAIEVSNATAGNGEWGVDDQMVFEMARARLPEMLTDSRPFLQVIETMGPHGANGLLSRRCSEDGHAERSRDVVEVVRCTAEDAESYVRALQEAHAMARRAHPLRIVVMSDHLNHNRAIRPTATEPSATNTVLFIGGPDVPSVNNVHGSMLDIYPTLLEWLGFAHPPVVAGLGRSLLSDEVDTLVAEYGRSDLDAMIVPDTALATLLWEGSE